MLERRVEEIEEERRSWGRSEGEKRRGEKEKGKGGGEVDANGGHEEDLKDVSCFEVHSWNRGSAEIMLYREQISIKMERRRKEWWGC
ncbi:hypothetical protein NC652_024822 [Populus alba x Populus x berolinensis]|nr:hypothetical protein NC652_024822 [Populus alba x Populus x berolinensis]